jgi:catechol 2,3-dioxygenase-like lactoylglutathione lyase family enzyme
MSTLNSWQRVVHLLRHWGSRVVGVAGLFVGLSSAIALHGQAPQRPRITGISHIGIFAHDYEKSRTFYGQFLGYQEPYSLKNPDGSPSMTFFKINDRQYIELYPEKQADTDRLSHISLETDDAEALRVYLASKGVKVPSAVHRGRIGNVGFDVTDPEGHVVEMYQYAPGGQTVENYGKFMSDDRVSTHMTHVGLIVTNLDAEYKFYTEILGFTEFWRGSSTGKVLSWINLKVPDGSDYIEFMLFAKEPDPTHRGTAHHMCLQVPDVAASVAALEAKPYFKTTYGQQIVVHNGVNRKRQANLYDPDGTRIELMEPDTIDGKPTPPSTAPPPQ